MSLDNIASRSQLSESLTKLKIEQDEREAIPEELEDHANDTRRDGSSSRHHVGTPHRHEGYGFRPPSGISTPMYLSKAVAKSPLPDAHGLGWPGEQFISYQR